MGELRSNHFHAGIDIKTSGVEGLPVYAAADGYISRMKISSWGYGNVLYVLHPNGETTVYAHLLNFQDKFQDYIREEQYKQRSFEMELFPEKNALPVKKGEVIAYSGNTGGSGGPHLHFEIRDRNQEVLNPLKYGFSEIKDDIAPQIDRLALVTMEKDARINGRFGRYEFDLVRSGNEYRLKSPIKVEGKIGIEILGHDKANGANNRNGISCIETKLDGKTIFYQNIAQFPFAKTRNILVFHNYEVYQQTGNRFYKLYVDKGNTLPFYKNELEEGLISVNDGSSHEVLIQFWDSFENKSELKFEVVNEESPLVHSTAINKSGNQSVERHGNILKIRSSLKPNTISGATVHIDRRQYDQDPDYIAEGTGIYLIDLEKGLPDSVKIGNETWKFNFRAKVPSSGAFNLYTPRADIYFPRNALFDTQYVQTDYWQDENREIFSIDQDLYPLQKNIVVTLKPKLTYDNKNKTHVYSLNGRGGYNFEGGDWQNMDIKFNTRNFGLFTLLSDTVPPVIKPITLSKESVKFTITDERSGIHSYETFIDGEWLLMHYDYKRSLIWSDSKNKNIPLSGELTLKVKDQAGNETIYNTKI